MRLNTVTNNLKTFWGFLWSVCHISTGHGCTVCLTYRCFTVFHFWPLCETHTEFYIAWEPFWFKGGLWWDHSCIFTRWWPTQTVYSFPTLFLLVLCFSNPGFWQLLFSGQFGPNPWAPPNVVHLVVMSDPSQDLIEDSNTDMQRTFKVLQFPFDEHRSQMVLQLPLLVVTYIVHRYDWMDFGIFIFLTSEDHASVSTVNWAAWNEYMERYSDNLTADSPQAGVVAQQLPLQLA